MTDLAAILGTLNRPRLLVGAARKGLGLYRRDRDLVRILPQETRPGRAGHALLAAEARLEETRKAGDATYSITRHIELLTALLAESTLAPRAA
ncbi:hypothetical protein GE300_15495 [Rhodobacteraceae bacterium 2CG4]|uniref:Uncharacterized protein n=1 Tax=Halovulum marinum TaxID=2662447 RepID=A0A6L5Z373_9RHOB|nr:DUF6477 family protein [Halovulum marinum]MSU90998.1 hypothetical protein [Halovulum marinum]